MKGTRLGIFALSAMLGGQAWAAPRPCDTCHAALAARWEPHREVTATCSACHVETGRRGACKGAKRGWSIKAGAGTACLGCHEDLTTAPAGRTLHAAIDGNECLGCHDPHGNAHKHALVAEGTVLCQRCHAKDAKPSNARARIDLKQKVVHGAVASGGCIGCHSGHSSKQPHLLADAADKLCASCHEAKAAKVPHKPVTADGCTRCHTAHASGAPGLLKAKTVRELCEGCHPAGEKASKHKPVAEGQCTGCHDPHGSDEEGMLRAGGNDLCSRCHASMERWTVTHHPVKNRGCVSCHEAHGTGKGLLDRPGNALCSKCHGKIRSGRHIEAAPNHPVAGKPDPSRPGRDLACISCHDPHGSESDRLLFAEDAQHSCRACHPKGT